MGILSLLAACGGGDCSSSALSGSWSGTVAGTADGLFFSKQCSFTSWYCGIYGTVPNVTTASGTLTFNVEESNSKSGCLTAGAQACSYSLSSTTLTFTCGAATFNYTKL